MGSQIMPDFTFAEDAAAIQQDLKKTAEIAKKQAPGIGSSGTGDNSMEQTKE